MYDSLLFGYGLSLAVSKSLSSSLKITGRQKEYLYFDTFFKAFITSNEHKRVYRDFLKYFKITQESALAHRNTKIYLASRLDEILSYGFERWVSKYLFSSDNPVGGDTKIYIYILYNYWAHVLYKELLVSSEAEKLYAKIGEKILQQIRNKEQIFTTNFDTFLDKYLHPHHLHGKFSLPLENITDLILYLDGEKFEYGYLFGTNGIEKLSRLDKIRKLTQDKYKLDFFYNRNIDLGHLLIYGLSFGTAEFFTKDFLNKYPKYKDDFLMRSIDGHILIKLNERFQKKLLSKITLSYHTNQDLEYLKKMFSSIEVASIVDFIHSSEVFQI
jgi:hypothetical protein